MQEPPSHGEVSAVERRASYNFERIVSYLKSRTATCCRDASGDPYLLFDNERIPLNWDQRNLALVGLMNQVVGTGTLTLEARLTIQRLQVWAKKRAESVRLGRFAAIQDGRIYIPMANGRLLVVSRDCCTETENGTNAASLWIEHPYGRPLEAFDPSVSPPQCEVLAGLNLFEELLVGTQACSEPEQWLVAMHEGLLPYVRDSLEARFILVHLGPSQFGKTTGAQRFLTLHGLGSVKGDYSLAALGDTGDIGLLALDNVEHKDLTRPLVNFLLFAATGAERGRSNPDGVLRTQNSRPMVVITSIEGLAKQELWGRCVSVSYRPADGAVVVRETNEGAIAARRRVINRALVAVLRCYLSLQDSFPAGTSPIPNFASHYHALCTLLEAYGTVAQKGASWAADIRTKWDAMFRARVNRADNEDPLERYILRAALEDRLGASPKDFAWHGKRGKLFVTSTSNLLFALDELRAPHLPETPSALKRRVINTIYTAFTVLDEHSEPNIPALRRRAVGRALGIFIPDVTIAEFSHSDEQDACHGFALTPIQGSLFADHHFLGAADECYFLWDYRPLSPDDPNTKLIRDFKLPPGRNKAEAIQQAAAVLSAAIPESLRQATFVPMPPSKAPGHPGYDSRLIQLLRWVTPGLDIQEILHAGADGAALQKGISPLDRAANLVATFDSGRLSDTIVLVDDVITSGAHFRAASIALGRVCGSRKIIGLFLARTIRETSASSAHNSA
jgi:predicted amidophosphoribosyltransferase